MTKLFKSEPKPKPPVVNSRRLSTHEYKELKATMFAHGATNVPPKADIERPHQSVRNEAEEREKLKSCGF